MLYEYVVESRNRKCQSDIITFLYHIENVFIKGLKNWIAHYFVCVLFREKEFKDSRRSSSLIKRPKQLPDVEVSLLEKINNNPNIGYASCQL